MITGPSRPDIPIPPVPDSDFSASTQRPSESPRLPPKPQISPESPLKSSSAANIHRSSPSRASRGSTKGSFKSKSNNDALGTSSHDSSAEGKVRILLHAMFPLGKNVRITR